MGSDIYTIDTSVKEMPISSEVTGDKPLPPAPAGPSAERVVVPVPIMGESITQGVLAKWNVKTNDTVQIDEVVASIETDKVMEAAKFTTTANLSPFSSYLSPPIFFSTITIHHEITVIINAKNSWDKKMHGDSIFASF